jgi:hypothetical protein
LLILPQLHEVSPPAQFIAEIQILRVASDLTQLNHCVILRFIDLLAADVGSSPGIEKAYFTSLSDIKVDEIQLFVVFIGEIHGVAVPETQKPALSLCVLIGKHSHKALDNRLHSFELG